MRRRIFISAPLGAPDSLRPARIRVALDAARALMPVAHPVVPHLWGLIPDADDWQSYEAWLAWCLEELATCQLVLRLPGHSPGADREVARARELGLPVRFTLEDAIVWARGPACVYHRRTRELRGGELVCGLCGAP